MKYLDTKKGSLEEAVQQSMSGVVAKDLIEAGGKYLKYSDLLLQKGRLMAKNKSTAMIDKEISKEMKKLGIKEGSDEYEKFFQSALKKFKVDSPADFKTDDKKKELIRQWIIYNSPDTGNIFDVNLINQNYLLYNDFFCKDYKVILNNI